MNEIHKLLISSRILIIMII